MWDPILRCTKFGVDPSKFDHFTNTSYMTSYDAKTVCHTILIISVMYSTRRWRLLTIYLYVDWILIISFIEPTNRMIIENNTKHDQWPPRILIISTAELAIAARRSPANSHTDTRIVRTTIAYCQGISLAYWGVSFRNIIVINVSRYFGSKLSVTSTSKKYCCVGNQTNYQ